jgi:hypothetical protein
MAFGLILVHILWFVGNSIQWLWPIVSIKNYLLQGTFHVHDVGGAPDSVKNLKDFHSGNFVGISCLAGNEYCVVSFPSFIMHYEFAESDRTNSLQCLQCYYLNDL